MDWIISLQFMLTISLFWAIISSTLRSGSLKSQWPFYSPANAAIEYRERVFQLDAQGEKFTAYQLGGASPALERDKLWNHLYAGYEQSAISKLEASRLPQLTLPLPEHPQRYIAALDVFHELHCLDRIRQRLLNFPSKGNNTASSGKTTNASTSDGHRFIWDHIDHCIDTLRQELMCLPDLQPIALAKAGEHGVVGASGNITRTCRSVERLYDWARERKVSDFDPQFFVENELAASFKEFGT